MSKISKPLRKKGSKYGFLTMKQIAVLKLRSKRYSLRKIADILKIPHQSVASIEKRALRNIELAKKTILIYNMVASPIKVLLREGTRHVDIPSLIINEADKVGVTIKADVGLILKYIWRNARDCIENRVVRKPILVLIDHNGEMTVYPYHQVKDILEFILEIERSYEQDHK
ncbi:MAG: Tfx family DNA-binding protein [Desulfurococcaceae archaeon]